MATALLPKTSNIPSRWELAAETIAVKIRWFGLLVGYVLVNLHPHPASHQAILNAILALGTVFTLVDTYHSVRGRIFLGKYPLVISAMEALFIGLLCYYDGGLNSTFRYYYFLSLVCCAIRHPPQITYGTCALHCLSFGTLYLVQGSESQPLRHFVLTLVVLGWVTWASNALALLLKQVGEYLGQLNTALRANQQELEARIEERTRQLQEAQAHVLHQEKMAAFGLLAAGIAHEVGNPLTSISTVVQMLQRRDIDPYVQSKLTLVSGQLLRIRTTLRELIEFSRPASTERAYISLGEILEEALSIAKYYKPMGGRIVLHRLPENLPPLSAVRDQLVQVFLNLILNALDATAEAWAPETKRLGSDSPEERRLGRLGTVDLEVEREGNMVRVLVRDNGCGIDPDHAEQVFLPYFTTKKHGTGLGLFVSRKLIHDHGGQVEMKSQINEGTTFLVRLPLAVDWNARTSLIPFEGTGRHLSGTSGS